MQRRFDDPEDTDFVCLLVGDRFDVPGIPDDHRDLPCKQVLDPYPVIAGGFTGHNLAAVVTDPIFQQEQIGLSTAEPLFRCCIILIDSGSGDKL